MDYEKKYKALVEAVKTLKEANPSDEGIQNWVNDNVPELKESEDERIRKALIKGVECCKSCGWTNFGNNEDIDVVLAWLEKQGEQNSIDGIEPKFTNGDWITNGDYTWKIVEVKPLDYIIQSQDGNIVDDTISYVDENFHIWTIQDAKDGDVLCCESGWTCIFKALDNHTNTFSSYCFMDSDKWFCNTGSEGHTLDKAFIKAYNGEIYPATKQQRDILMKAMADAGYTFDFEKKELKKIEHKPAVWSEEDEKVIHCLEYTVKHFYEDEDTIKWCCDWLKSLRPQNKWKPSDEQIGVIEAVINNRSFQKRHLDSLYEQLKKLKGE